MELMIEQVIPTNAGSQFSPRPRINNTTVIPAQAGIQI
jgi:hypothetical protein